MHVSHVQGNHTATTRSMQHIRFYTTRHGHGHAYVDCTLKPRTAAVPKGGKPRTPHRRQQPADVYWAYANAVVDSSMSPSAHLDLTSVQLSLPFGLEDS